MVLTRESLRNGDLARMIRASGDGDMLLPDAERERSLDETLAEIGSDDPVWVFGYGSLIWNPAFHFEHQTVATLEGYHRAFCLWTPLGRGSHDEPGLTLGLEQGGDCTGVAFRIAPENVRSELDIIWRREMVTGAYRPTWVRMTTAESTLTGITFVINRDHDRYAGQLPQERVVRALCRAEGHLGTCRDYLFNTVTHLNALGLQDPSLEYLCRQVEALKGSEHDAGD